jgi:hypothetical protein
MRELPVGYNLLDEDFKGKFLVLKRGQRRRPDARQEIDEGWVTAETRTYREHVYIAADSMFEAGLGSSRGGAPNHQVSLARDTGDERFEYGK